MHEPSDGIAEELERQLQLVLATAAIAARRAIAAREQTLEQAKRESEQAARATQARIDAERLLAAERLRPVFDAAWWETANPTHIGEMWREANSWRDAEQSASATPTIFDHAAHRIREEVRDRSGLDATQVVTLTTIQDLEHEHQTTVAEAINPEANLNTDGQDPLAFDDPQRREQLRGRLAAAGLPEPAIQARTLADLGQAQQAERAVQTPVSGATQAKPAAHRTGRELHRQR